MTNDDELDDGDDDVVCCLDEWSGWLEGSLFCAHKILCWPTQNFV